jgi:phage-related protein
MQLSMNFKPAIVEQAEKRALLASQEREAAAKESHHKETVTSLDQIVARLSELAELDIKQVVSAVQELDKTIEGNRVDLSPLQASLDALPKELPRIPEPLDAVAITNLSDLNGKFDALEAAIRHLKLDPTIKVSSPAQTAPSVDLEPLQDAMLRVVQAVKDQTFPEPALIDLAPLAAGVEQSNKKLDEANRKLQRLVEKPVGGGGGGGGGGIAPSYAVHIDDVSTPGVIYIGKAATAATTSTPVWQLAKLDTSSGLIKTWADGDASFDNVWDDRTTITYS